jgi:hypothetical protein
MRSTFVHLSSWENTVNTGTIYRNICTFKFTNLWNNESSCLFKVVRQKSCSGVWSGKLRKVTAMGGHLSTIRISEMKSELSWMHL